jgi:predicted AAA+ superfamily ATPase
MFDRYLNLKSFVKLKSLLFLGPRQTGKSTLLTKEFPNAHFINLLESDTYREYYTYPERLREKLPTPNGVVVIDEIQLVPQLLNEVHLLIEKHKNLKFILTGSSARKLKGSSVNLLAGRAWPIHFHPLTSQDLELKNDKDWLRYLNRGGIPVIFESQFPSKDLSAYIGTYLQEEIKAEGLVRSSERFSRFLDVASFCNGEVLNFAKVASDCGVPARTVREYFSILTDTLLAYLLSPLKTSKRKNVATSKFYLFDLGVTNHLLHREINSEDSENFGKVLEQLIFLELKAYIDYKLCDEKIYFWRTHEQKEVNFVVSRKLAIEVKASKNTSLRDFKNIDLLTEEKSLKKIQKILVCREKGIRKIDSNTLVINYREFLKRLWKGEFF